MTAFSWQWWLAYGSMALLMFIGVLLMVIILLQRGRGGGLAGAFGGAGGQSAFGTRAGDVFTKITAVMAIVWVFLAGVSRFALEPYANQRASSFQSEEELRDQDAADNSILPKNDGEGENATDTDSPMNEGEDPMKTPSQDE